MNSFGLLGTAVSLLAVVFGWGTERTWASQEPAGNLTVDFETMETGKAPTGFSMALTGGGGPAAWVIKDDPTALTGPGPRLDLLSSHCRLVTFTENGRSAVTGKTLDVGRSPSR